MGASVRMHVCGGMGASMGDGCRWACMCWCVGVAMGV